jgi:hypothetical protein
VQLVLAGTGTGSRSLLSVCLLEHVLWINVEHLFILCLELEHEATGMSIFHVGSNDHRHSMGIHCIAHKYETDCLDRVWRWLPSSGGGYPID